jgi:magnesium-transporting ATPase (P-type)
LIQKLSVIEILGTVTTICTDKSGTLTQNQMTVRDIWVNGNNLKVSGGGYQPSGEIVSAPSSGPQKRDVELLLSAALLCNNSRLSPPSEERPLWTALGDQTEAAMRVAALKGRINEQELVLVLPRIHELPFDARRKRMSTMHQLRSDPRMTWLDDLIQSNSPPANFAGEVAFVKGAPREILQICTNTCTNIHR